jgi:hypothetical protein
MPLLVTVCTSNTPLVWSMSPREIGTLMMFLRHAVDMNMCLYVTYKHIFISTSSARETLRETDRWTRGQNAALDNVTFVT